MEKGMEMKWKLAFWRGWVPKELPECRNKKSKFITPIFPSKGPRIQI